MANKMTRTETVAIIHQPPRILLGMKKLRFGKGKYNGFGGGIENGETLEECAIRETLEEAGITIINPERFGRILFEFQTKEQAHLVYFFKVRKFIGNPVESNEIRPKWFNETKIPYDKMWEDDKYWLPLLLREQKFAGYFHFNKENKISRYELNRVDEIV